MSENVEDKRAEEQGYLARVKHRLKRGLMTLSSNIYYRSPLKIKILVPVFVITLSVIGILAWLSLTSLHTTIAGIYEQRARSVANVVSKSLQEKAYILYYSDQLEHDINTLMTRYDSIVGITVSGVTGRGLRVVASTDSSLIGKILSQEAQGTLLALRDVRVRQVRVGGEAYLRADYPLFMDADLVGVVSVDMSLAEQQRYVNHLSLELGLASVIGFLVLGFLIYGIVSLIVTRPILRLAAAAESVSQRNYGVQVSTGPVRQAGLKVRDEMARFIDVFNLMIKVIGSREQALRDVVMLDEETGTYTFSYFQRLLDQELKKGARYGHPTSVLIVDISPGEGASEEDKKRLLQATANLLIAKLRSVDPVFRVSEQRFVALLPETPLAGAQVASRRLSDQVANLNAEMGLDFTISVRAGGWSGQEAPSLKDILSSIQPAGEDDPG
ncbi:MAG TPA: diguanylate cyclase [Candidatus Acetothermia bacterium]|nr:diguanylate cyclase [Candidatus Acetothermia bacterium]HEX32630.1 diguanylate cyclase [Candidatus Acetothermia bacterium]